MPARRSQTFIGARHRARLARKDTPVAITARELACLIYVMVTRGEAYVEKGMDPYEKQAHRPTLSNLHRDAQHHLARFAGTVWALERDLAAGTAAFGVMLNHPPVCRSHLSAGPQPPPPGVSMTKISPTFISARSAPCRISTRPSVLTTLLRPGAPLPPPASP